MQDAGAAVDPASYRFWIEDQVRFADLDVIGHCNNAAIASFFESGRVALLTAAGIGFRGTTAPVIVRVVTNFRRELLYATKVRVGTRIVAFGRTSFTLGNGVFDGDACAADAEVVAVLLDPSTRRPVPLTDAVKASLSALA